jgi:hypothetical protein
MEILNLNKRLITEKGFEPTSLGLHSSSEIWKARSTRKGGVQWNPFLPSALRGLLINTIVTIDCLHLYQFTSRS